MDRIAPAVASFLRAPFAGSGGRFPNRVRPSLFQVRTQLRLPNLHISDFMPRIQVARRVRTTATTSFPAVIQPACHLGVIVNHVDHVALSIIRFRRPLRT